MGLSFRKTCIITIEELRKIGLMPPQNRLKRGPVVLIECPEEIPCNICVDACPFNAISMERITSIPKVDWDKCVGCGVCVTSCPGLAIFVVDVSREDTAFVTVPYEFLPRPKPGEKVMILGRDGRSLGQGVVKAVFEQNKTLAVKIEVPKEIAFEVKGIRVVKTSG